MPDCTQQRSVRVLVVDDGALVRAGLRAACEGEGFDVVVVASAEAALRINRSFAADVVVLPGTAGIDATRRLAGAVPATALLTLAAAADRPRLLDALRAGSSGYLLADVELEDVVAAVRAVAAGHTAIDPRVAGALVAEVRTIADAAAPDRPLDLTEREHDLLEMVTSGMRNVDIGRRLYVSPSTVKCALSRLFVKIGVENRVQAAAYAVRHGAAPGSSPRSRQSSAVLAPRG